MCMPFYDVRCVCFDGQNNCKSRGKSADLHCRVYSNCLVLCFHCSVVLQMLAKARSIAEEHLKKHLYKSASFWAEKALILSSNELQDVFLTSQVFYASGQYQRASNLLQKNSQYQQSSILCYLLAKCHAECKEWEVVLTILSFVNLEATKKVDKDLSKLTEIGNVESSCLLLEGIAHENLGTIPKAIECFTAALKADVYCVEALDHLTSKQYLTADEEKKLIEGLPFNKQCSHDEESVLLYLYQSKAKGCKQLSSSMLPSSCKELENCSDVICSQAERTTARVSYSLTRKVLEQDQFNEDAILLHVSTCVYQKKSTELYALGQRLVGSFPELSIAWYTVACYYLAICQYTDAAKYLEKVLSIDKMFPHAWLAYGLSFADRSEHDQAISAFSNAAHIMRGSHIPLLYLAREYFHTGVTAISNRFVKKALTMSPGDPVVLQEVGFLLFQAEKYPLAEAYFKNAIVNLQTTDSSSSQMWEAIYNNLGHVYRKQAKYNMALEMHKKALQIDPEQPSTLADIAFVSLLMDKYEDAITFSTRSLQLRRQDHLTLLILETAIKQASQVSVLPEVDSAADQTIKKPDEDRLSTSTDMLIGRESMPSTSSSSFHSDIASSSEEYFT